MPPRLAAKVRWLALSCLLGPALWPAAPARADGKGAPSTPAAAAPAGAPAAAPSGVAPSGSSGSSGSSGAAVIGSTAPSEWNQPLSPFRVIGNIYHVGARGVSAFFISTPAGAILLDGGLTETAPLIEENIVALGFRVKDVKVLLNSHAHFDHAGGLAALQKASGARVVASQGDAPALRAGGEAQPAVRVDRVIADGDTVELGGTVLTAHVTPGHTPGCTTWSMNVVEAGRSHPVVFYCSTSVVDRLLGNARYPSIVADYERSFVALRALPCDVFLGPHGDFFQLVPKRERMSQGAPNPFIDPGELRRFVDRSEQSFRQALEKERRAAPAPAAPAAPPRS